MAMLVYIAMTVGNSVGLTVFFRDSKYFTGHVGRL